MKNSLEELMKMEEVIGILLVGSSSMGNKYSDNDYEVVVTNNLYKNLENLDRHYTLGNDEFLFISENDFEKKLNLV